MLPVSPRKVSDIGKPRKRIEDESAIEEVYKMGDVLGKGSFGIVKEVTHHTSGQKYAMKTVNKDKPGSMSILLLEREVEVLNRVNHPHLIQLIEVYETQKKVFIILEMCRGGELSDELKKRERLHEDEVRVIMRQLAEAVVYMHSNDMVHRDLKLENILLSTDHSDESYNIKVTDFGLSHMKALDGDSDNSMYSRCGTPYYMAPEVLRNKHEYSQLCDVWSMGVIMYALLCGRMPFNGETAAHLEESIMSGHLKFKEPEWISISTQAKDLVEGMLMPDTVRRFTARQVLEDPWITGSKDKQRIDPFKMLMDDSPTPSPPAPRPRSEIIETPTDSIPSKLQTNLDRLKQSERKPRTSSIDEETKTTPHKPHSRSKSLYNSRTSRTSTPKLILPNTPKGREGAGDGGPAMRKKPTAVNSGQLQRPNTGMTRQTHESEQKQKLSSAKR